MNIEIRYWTTNDKRREEKRGRSPEDATCRCISGICKVTRGTDGRTDGGVVFTFGPLCMRHGPLPSYDTTFGLAHAED
jgi:hypothetical protein